MNCSIFSIFYHKFFLLMINYMKIDFKKIINIKNKQQLKEFSLDKPIFNSNYLFHYLVSIGNLDALKLEKFPVYLENNDGLNAFHIAAKENQIEILNYLIENYPDYIYNRNKSGETFTIYLEYEEFNNLIKKHQNLDWEDLLLINNKENNSILVNILNNFDYKQLNEFISLIKIKPEAIIDIGDSKDFFSTGIRAFKMSYILDERQNDISIRVGDAFPVPPYESRSDDGKSYLNFVSKAFNIPVPKIYTEIEEHPELLTEIARNSSDKKTDTDTDKDKNN